MLSLLDRLLTGRISSTALAFGTVAYRHGDRAGGERLLGIACAAAPKNVALLRLCAEAAAEAGAHPDALRFCERALRIAPDDRDLILSAARAQFNAGDPEGAARRCEQAIARITAEDPGLKLMQVLAQLRLPGPIYLDVMAMLHRWLRPRTYLEIGVAAGDSIVLIEPGTRAIGVDPMPVIDKPLPAGAAICAQTSDDFFGTQDVRALLGGLAVDVAFIDGMHLFEFALRDFINVEKHCEAGSTILMDDCWPLNERVAARERATHFWTGDVWRVIPALRKYRPNLRIRVIATAPAGLAVVRGLDPASRTLSENYDAIVQEFGALPYAEFAARRDAYLEPCANDWDSIRRLFA